MRQPLVYIVILNWNGYRDTVECLKSIAGITYSNYKIVLVDNGSSRSEYTKLKGLTKLYGDLTTLRSEQNLGFAGGCNKGIRYSQEKKASFILLLNNDTIVDEGFIEPLVDTAAKDSRIAVVGSKNFFYDEPGRIWVGGVHFNYYFPPLSRAFDAKTPVEVNSIVGCSMLIRATAFQEIGYFDELYFAYGEEDDFNFRAKRSGYKLIYCPSSHVWHKVSSSTGGGFNPRVAYLKMRNKILFAKKNYPSRYIPTYTIFLIAYFLKSQLKVLARRDAITSLALLKGLRDGLTL